MTCTQSAPILLGDVYYLRHLGATGHGWIEHPGGPDGTTSLHLSATYGDAFGDASFDQLGPQDKGHVIMHVAYTKSDSPDENLGGTAKKCKCATCEDVYQCLQGQFRCAAAQGYNVFTRNCRIVSVTAARNCCLKDDGAQSGAP